MNGFVSKVWNHRQNVILKLKFIKSLQHLCHYCDISLKFVKPTLFSRSFFSQLILMYHFRKRHVQTFFIQLLKISNLLSEQNRIEQIFSACAARVKKILIRNSLSGHPMNNLKGWCGNCDFLKKTDVKHKRYIKYCRRFSNICQMSVAIGSAWV